MTDMVGHIDTETLSGYSDGDVNAAVAARVERHLRECATCRAALARVSDLVSSARALPRAKRKAPEARVGGQPDCETRLSVYNKRDKCWAHAEMKVPRLRGRKPAAGST